MEYIINLFWDNEAGVWIATSDDISGLVLESNSLDALIEKVKIAVPELLELNKKIENKTASLHFLSEKYVEVCL